MEESVVTFLVDGSFAHKEELAGIGWVLLSPSGALIQAAAHPVRTTSALETEAKAILAALQAAQQLSLSAYHIWSHCPSIVNIIHGIARGPPEVENLLVDGLVHSRDRYMKVFLCDQAYCAPAHWLAERGRLSGSSLWSEQGFPITLVQLVSNVVNFEI